jgi:MscS family membrane protein
MNTSFWAIDWHFLDEHIGEEKVSNYLWFAGIIITTLLLKRPVAVWITRVGSGFIRRLGDAKHVVVFRTLLRKPIEYLLQSVFFYVAAMQLGLLLDHTVLSKKKGPSEKILLKIDDLVDHVFLFLIIIFTALLFARIIDFIYQLQLDKSRKARNIDRMQILPLMKEMSKLLIGIIGIFWILGSVFHVNIPALITGLGIGGVAVALAAKESVENLFASFTILLDKPFQTGDVIKLGELEGTVERIGFRSTRLRNMDGASNIIPNKKLVDENLENLSRRDKRRVKLVLNLKYNIPAEALQQMTKELKEMLEQKKLVKEPIDIIADVFGENTFQLSITYFLPHPLPEEYSLVVIKHEINMMAYEIVSKYRRFGTAYITGKE